MSADIDSESCEDEFIVAETAGGRLTGVWCCYPQQEEGGQGYSYLQREARESRGERGSRGGDSDA